MLPCLVRCCQPRSIPGSARAGIILLLKNFSLPCDKSLAVTSNKAASRKRLLIGRKNMTQQIEQELPSLEKPPSGDARQTGPCVMVIFGATGDLTARKLFPALYNLAKSNLLSREFAIVGVARNDYSNDQFRQMMAEKLSSFATSAVYRDLQEWLMRRVYYCAGGFDEPATYTRL